MEHTECVQCLEWVHGLLLPAMVLLLLPEPVSHQSQPVSNTCSDCAKEMSFSYEPLPPKLVPVSAQLGSQLFLQFIEGSLPHCLVSHEENPRTPEHLTAAA